MRSMRFLTMLAFSLMLCANQAYADTEVREEKLLLPIQIDSHVEQIEALIVRPVKGEKFPIALIVNGTAAASPSAAHADWLAHIAHDFAHRGWLAASIVWPGYGRSTGRFMDEAGTCANPDVARFLDAHGKELGAALASLRERPDVDPSLVLGLGISIGGASMLDLAAQPGRPLSAVINISGGVYHYTNVGSPESDCSLYQADLLRNLMKFGKDNPTPTIWIYADNDPFFNPDLVARMVASYRSQGGNADVVTLPAFGNNGHTLYKQDANPLLKPHIEDFLRKNRFPAMDDSALTPLFLKLASRDRASAKAYLKSVTEKAMAMPTQGSGIFWYYGARSIQTARQQAISQCRKATGKPCRIVTENMELISGWQNMVPPSTQ